MHFQHVGLCTGVPDSGLGSFTISVSILSIHQPINRALLVLGAYGFYGHRNIFSGVVVIASMNVFCCVDLRCPGLEVWIQWSSGEWETSCRF